MAVPIWTGTQEHQQPTRIWYPKARLATMGSETMPHHDVFQRAESLSPQQRQEFWCGEGGEHMIRFSHSEQHQCHLLFAMWNDFQQLDFADQQACKAGYIKQTYGCLSKARNSTRVIRQLQAFAHFVCGDGDMYIEPSKFIQCDSEVISQRALFKKLVKKVLARVEESEQKHKAAVKRKEGPPSKHVLKKTTVKKQPIPKIVAISIPLCESVAEDVLAEHPLIDEVVDADVEDGLPIYTIKIRDASSGEPQVYSYDALAIRKENLSSLAAYNEKWKKDVARVGEQIDPDTSTRTPIVTWKGKPAVSEVSKKFFEVVDWMGYYDLIQPSIEDDEKRPFTPVRPAGTSRSNSVSPLSSISSSTASTPLSSAEKRLQQIEDLVSIATSKKMSATSLRALFDKVQKAVREEPSSPAAETEQEFVSESEDMEDVGVEEEVKERNDEEGRDDGDDEAERDDEGAEAAMDEEAEGDEQPRHDRRAKRKAMVSLTFGKKRPSQRGHS